MSRSRTVLSRTVAPLCALLALALALAPTVQAVVRRPHPWRANFERGNFSEWSFSGQGQSYMWGHLAVLDPRVAGIPRRQGRLAARFETTPRDIATGHPHAKVYQWWHRPRRGRWDISGRYCASYFFPRSYHTVPRSPDNVFQFKHEWVDGGGFHQDPTWWVEIDTAREWGLRASRPNAPVAVLYHLQPRPPVTPRVVPLGRWIRICASVRQGRSVTVRMAGRRLGRGTARQYPVGPLPRDRRWIFGVGNYSYSANGPLWIDAASFSPAR